MRCIRTEFMTLDRSNETLGDRKFGFKTCADSCTLYEVPWHSTGLFHKNCIEILLENKFPICGICFLGCAAFHLPKARIFDFLGPKIEFFFGAHDIEVEIPSKLRHLSLRVGNYMCVYVKHQRAMHQTVPTCVENRVRFQDSNLSS